MYKPDSVPVPKLESPTYLEVPAESIALATANESTNMSTKQHFDDFLRESTNADPGSDRGLKFEELFGLYTSWCLLNGCPAKSAESLWTALRERNIVPSHNTLAMTGATAADYILASAPELV